MHLLRFLLVCAVAVVVAMPLPAATISYNYSFPSASVNFNSSSSVQQFDPTLGTLTMIEFFVDGFISGQQAADNEDPGNFNNVSFTTSVLMTLLASGNTLLTVTPSINNIANLAGDDEPGLSNADFLGPDSATFLFTNTQSSNSTSTTSPGLLALFTGLGTTALDLTGVGSILISGAGGNLSTNFLTTGLASGSVRYTYTPSVITAVPEPGTLGLAAMGCLLTFAGLRRRRKADSGS